jgi:NAD(P)-dependent dehydrogenase (short-subunit alcohol dehydrogenase family)
MVTKFQDQTVLLTGATGGIGGETARQFAAHGARLVLVDRRHPSTASIDALYAAGARTVLSLECDVGEEDQVESAYRAAISHAGAPQIVVNVAGQMSYKSLESLTQSDWIAMLSANFLGAAFFIRQAFFSMPAGGSIVNIASVHAERTTPGVAPYAAAKAALVSLTRSAALEGKPKGIRVNAVLPGAVDTQMLRDSPNIKSGVEVIEPGEIGEPAQIAATVLFLASAEAAFITGAALVADGGRLARL